VWRGEQRRAYERPCLAGELVIGGGDTGVGEEKLERGKSLKGGK